ncbi:MAG: nucleotidyltransferase domain-containing protein [Spirochaetales bacterium]|jgi:uncharacterized protein|nr:nucleotidyltransferase domain-containing protein [Spirochaetales bacterium]
MADMRDPGLLRQSPDPLFGRTQNEVLTFLTTGLQGKVHSAYYFGSFLSERFTRHSDIDLIIVKDTDIPFLERPLEFDYLREFALSLDILVYTLAEFEKLITDPSPGFWRTVTREMVRFI